MAKLKFGDTSSCPAMYPTQEGGKFGLTVDNFIGDVTNGVLSGPSTINGITFTDVTEISSYALKHAFYSSNRIFGLVAFPALTTVDTEGLNNAFSTNQITSVDLSSLTSVGSNGLYNAFSSNQITSVDLSSLTTISGDNGLGSAFENNKITSVDLSSLTSVANYGLQAAFRYNQITSVDLSSLTSVDNYGLDSAFSTNKITSVDLSSLTLVGSSGLSAAFVDNKITSADLSNLTSVAYNGLASAFYYNQIITVDLSSLTSVGNYGLAYTFQHNGYTDVETGMFNTSLQSVSFPMLTSQSFIGLEEEGYREYFTGMLSENSNVTVHFPSNLQSVIGNWDDVTNGFGGTNTTVLFDLPATE